MFRGGSKNAVLALPLTVLMLGPGKGGETVAGGNRRGFWAPVRPPAASYTIDCRIDPGKDRIEGEVTIQLRNHTTKCIDRLAVHWAPERLRHLSVSLGGEPIPALSENEKDSISSPIPFDLVDPLAPGDRITIDMRFDATYHPQRYEDRIRIVDCIPTLWWGRQTHDEYHVTIHAPPAYTIAASGLGDPHTGSFHGDSIRTFGIYLGKGQKMIESRAGDVLVRCLYTDRGETCARLILDTAVDAINYYRDRFGFYPHKSLSIVPYMDRPAGGYPLASGLVMIHGLEKMEERSELHWRWITAHEIGHQYWMEHVLEKEEESSWLMIGLGLYTDREYIRERGLDLSKHRKVMNRYITGVRMFLDTTADRTEEELQHVEFDFNNVVTHGKGFSIISALACILGRDTFDRICRRCLREYRGRQMDVHDFQSACEEESSEDLEWFFHQWVRTNRYLSYGIASQRCTKRNGLYESVAVVERMGTLKMPVPVLAWFAGGTQQLVFTDRLLDADTIRFDSEAPLEGVVIDPGGELALVVPPPSEEAKSISEKIENLPFAGAGGEARDCYEEAQKHELVDPWLWGKLGLLLYDGEYYEDALASFQRGIELIEEDSPWLYAGLVWKGHVLDILGKREEAVRCYREALDRYTGRTMKFSQYNMTIDKEWIHKRIEKPFKRK